MRIIGLAWREKFIAPFSALAIIAGCAADKPATRVSSWDCGGLGRLTTKWLDNNAVEIAINGRSLQLPRALSGSGARYSDGLHEAWEHQNTLRWTGEDGKSWTCVKVKDR